MSLYRRAARRDAVEARIVSALERCGWSVTRLSAPGCPDLLLGHRVHGQLLAEVKSADGTFTTEQKEWRRCWKGPAPIVLRSVEDVEALMQPVQRKWEVRDGKVERIAPSRRS